jgi:hypothetical protein
MRLVIDSLKEYANACLYFTDRRELFVKTREFRRVLHDQIKTTFEVHPIFAKELGIDPDPKLKFEVPDIRRASKISPNGYYVPQMIVSLTQSKRILKDAATGVHEHRFRGGSTLIVDLPTSAIKYRIVKNIESPARRRATADSASTSARTHLDRCS